MTPDTQARIEALEDRVVMACTVIIEPQGPGWFVRCDERMGWWANTTRDIVWLATLLLSAGVTYLVVA